MKTQLADIGPVFKVGDVIVSDEVRNGKAAKSPLMIYAEAQGKDGFRLCDENRIALAVGYSEDDLLSFGYTVAGQVDMADFKVDESATLEGILSTEHGEFVLTVTKSKAKPAKADLSVPTTPDPVADDSRYVITDSQRNGLIGLLNLLHRKHRATGDVFINMLNALPKA